MKLKLFKLMFDRSLAAIGLLLATPFLLLISVLIWLDEPGSVLFGQTRLGLKGKPFRLLKFRKFSAKCDDSGPGVTVAGDTRMTFIGSILERTKLDELPQLWNIVQGEMSFVGPRPESMRFADMFQGEYLKVLDFLPGLFGPCQIAFRNESSLYPADEDPELFYRRALFPQKAQLDIEYFANSSAISDFSWIVRGLWVTLAGAINWRELRLSYAKNILTDTVIVLSSWILACSLLFSTLPYAEFYQVLQLGVYWLPPIVIASLIWTGCYRSYGQDYFYFVDALKLLHATTLSLAIALIAILTIAPINALVYLLPIEWLLLLFGLSTPRIWARYRREKRLKIYQNPGLPVFVYGANSSGIALANWLIHGQQKTVLAFFDDLAHSHGKQLMGIPVLSRTHDILSFQSEHPVSEIWVAQPLSEVQKISLANFCSAQNIALMLFPEAETVYLTQLG